ncbi:hypothetical protein Tco_0689473 [Tanacetum coccineum]
MDTTKAQQIALDDALIYPRLPSQKFEDPPFKEEILSFIRDLSHTREIKVLTDVNVNHMHQPWRSFAAIINRCLSGKTTSLDSLCLSHAQIIWGMYHKKNVDYVYLLWEDMVYQVENKNSNKRNDMCYPPFTKVIIDYFMLKDQSISRRNNMFWHTARDDPMFNTIRVISRHQDTYVYGAILPNELTNQEMLDSKAYKEYYAVASGAKPPKAKTKYKKKADEHVIPSKSKYAPVAKGIRIKTPSKVTQSGKKKQPASVPKAKGLKVLSEVELSKDEQMKIATKRSKTQFHSSHTSGSGVCVFTSDWPISSLPNVIDSNPDIYPPPIEDPLLIRDTLFYQRPPGKTRKVKGVATTLDPFQMVLSELKNDFKKWETIFSEIS